MESILLQERSHTVRIFLNTFYLFGVIEPYVHHLHMLQWLRICDQILENHLYDIALEFFSLTWCF